MLQELNLGFEIGVGYFHLLHELLEGVVGHERTGKSTGGIDCIGGVAELSGGNSYGAVEPNAVVGFFFIACKHIRESTGHDKGSGKGEYGF